MITLSILLLAIILMVAIIFLYFRFWKKDAKDIRKLFIQKINEQKEELNSKDNRLSSVLDNLPVILFFISKEGKLTFIEGKGMEKLGFSKTDSLGKSVSEITEIIPQFAGDFKRALQGEEFPSVIPCKDFIFETKFSTYLDDKGSIDGVIGVAIDITEKIKAEQMLHKNQQMQELILNSVPMMLYAAEASGDFSGTWITENVKQMTGFSPAHFTNDAQFWSSRLHPEEKQYVLKEYLFIAQKGKIDIQYRWQCADGEYKWFRDYAVLAKDRINHRMEIIGIWEDITGKKKLEEEIKASDTKYKTLVERMNEGLLYVDQKNIIRFVNDRFCKITGYNEGEVIGKSIYDLLLREADQNLMKTKTDLRRSGVSDEYEMEIQKKSGEKIFIRISASPITDEQGNFNGSMGVLSDITQQKKTENNLKSKVKELDTFMYKASHDLRGPLSSMLGLVNVARQEITDHGALAYFDLVGRSASRLDNILLDLLQITRIAQGEIQLTPIHFDTLIQEITKSLAYLPDFDEIKFRTTIQTEKEFKSDKRLILSVFQNLIDNAIKYRRRNTSSYIFISVSEENNHIRISIEDNGMGIHRDLQDKVFDMFFRASLTSTGSGLGLYIVKNAVEKLGGSIHLKSEEGLGSELTVYLPFKE